MRKIANKFYESCDRNFISVLKVFGAAGISEIELWDFIGVTA